MPPGVLPVVAPGVYPGPGQATLLYEGCQLWLFEQQLIAAGKASIAVQLRRERGSSYPFGASLQISFTNSSGAAAAPGAFEVDFQTSDIDQDNQYVTISSVTAVNANNACRIEMPSFWARYMRAYIPTLTNAVYSNILVTR